MAATKELYISFDRQEYKQNKANILNSQIDLLSSIRHLEHLKKISIQKNQLKIEVCELFSQTLVNLNIFQEKMPILPAPKLSKPLILKKTTEALVKTKNQEIDTELQEIQEKLKKLNL